MTLSLPRLRAGFFFTAAAGDAGELGAADAAVVEAGGDERPRAAESRKALEIGDIPHPARGMEPAVGGARAQRHDPLQIGPAAAADAGQGHDDHPPRPERRILEYRLRPEPLLAPEIERQHEPRMIPQPREGRRLGEGLGAEHRHRPALPPEARERRGVGEAGIDPETEPGKARLEAPQQGAMIAAPFDRVEIGEIEGAEGMEGEKPLDHRHRVGRGGDPRIRERTVAAAFAGAGADHEAAHEIEHRDHLEGHDPLLPCYA